MYEKVKRDIFLQWWKISSWPKTHTNQDKKKERHTYWENDKKFNIWKHFEKHVIVENNNSKIICKRCNFVLEYSFAENEIYTTKTHLSFKQCVKIAKVENFSLLTIKKICEKTHQIISYLQISKKINKNQSFCLWTLFCSSINRNIDFHYLDKKSIED
jgi:hypothetical protein